MVLSSTEHGQNYSKDLNFAIESSQKGGDRTKVQAVLITNEPVAEVTVSFLPSTRRLCRMIYSALDGVLSMRHSSLIDT